MFTLFDLKKDGFIGKEACKDALKTLASSEFQFQEIEQQNSIPDKVDAPTFAILCTSVLGIAKAWNFWIKYAKQHILSANMNNARAWLLIYCIIGKKLLFWSNFLKKCIFIYVVCIYLASLKAGIATSTGK